MTGLPPDYFVYPHRRRGMDHERYPYRILPRTQPFAWPGGARVALWIAVHAGHFPMDMPLKPVVAPGGMERPYPSFWDFTQRDYGNRIGIYRMMQVMAARGLKGTALLSAALAREYPVLMDDIAAAGWEPACAGLDMGHIHHGQVPEAEEAAWVEEATSLLRARFGDALRGWHSPAHSESHRTPDLVAKAGYAWTSGWVNDDLPYAFATQAGPMMAMPLPQDLSDQRMLHQQNMATEDYVAATLAAHAALDAEAAATGSGRILTLAVTPWLMGQAHRIRAFAAMLDAILARGGVWPATASEILAAYSGSR
ncbi:polysaccharide deacetylase family protein [Roseomonas sp. PWR1]|uniref:Polysaccharide deacetylase family protein n=1 Tax=Roseomonas nitratireducens TaxID=2820810 RepID=A0ABS4ALX4_9PROT|nr:polysaccharide deacetylase family protein [Neoroseomonas nitratireducens]MBP0462363.1 polysaccharide deacetylase family protein [Neoroseomonas nitratireducens]